MTKTAQRLAELQAKPELDPWEQRYVKYLANIVRKQARYPERKVRRAQREGWCAQ